MSTKTPNLLCPEGWSIRGCLEKKVEKSWMDSKEAFVYTKQKNPLAYQDEENSKQVKVTIGDVRRYLSSGSINGIDTLANYNLNTLRIKDFSPNLPTAVYFDKKDLVNFPSRFQDGKYCPPPSKLLKAIKKKIKRALSVGTAIFLVEEEMVNLRDMPGAPAIRYYCVALLGLGRLQEGEGGNRSEQRPYAVVLDGTRSWGRQSWDSDTRAKKTPAGTASHKDQLDIITGPFRIVARIRGSDNHEPPAFVYTSIPVPFHHAPEAALLHAAMNAQCTNSVRQQLLVLCDQQPSHRLVRVESAHETNLDGFWTNLIDTLRGTTLWTSSLFELLVTESVKHRKIVVGRIRSKGQPTAADAALNDMFLRRIFTAIYGDQTDRDGTLACRRDVGQMLISIDQSARLLLEETVLLQQELNRESPAIRAIDAVALTLLSSRNRVQLIDRFLLRRQFLFSIGIPSQLKQCCNIIDEQYLQKRDQPLLEVKSLPDIGHLAMYSALLCCALHLGCADEGQGQSIGSVEQSAFITSLLHLALRCFNETDWIKCPNLSFLQACILLNPVMCARGEQEAHFILLQSALTAAKNLGIHRLPNETNSEHETMRPLERHTSRLLWFNIVQGIALYAFDSEDPIVVPRLDASFDISNANDDAVCLATEPGSMIEERNTGDYTDASFARCRLDILRVTSSFLLKLKAVQPTYIDKKTVSRMQASLLSISLPVEPAGKVHQTRGAAVNPQEFRRRMEFLALLNIKHAFICRYGQPYQTEDNDIARAILNSRRAMNEEDAKPTYIPSCLLFWPVSAGRQIEAAEGADFYDFGVMDQQ